LTLTASGIELSQGEGHDLNGKEPTAMPVA